MIKDRINALFSFIEFLHSNIDNFKGYDILINELYTLDIERNKVRGKTTFTDKLKYDEVQAKIKSKFEIINENIIELIKDKSNELNICDWTKTETLWNYNILEISELKENFSTNDIPEILKNKTKYLEFRKKTNCDYFQTFFFSDLDKILKVLFDFFKESNENEFKAFEVKKIEVNDISEAVELFHKGHNTFLIPASNTNLKQRLSKSLSDINFFQIFFEINNNKEYNNDSFIKPENWDNLKDIFYSQRMEKYNSSFTQIEKIKLELEDLENLNINETDYKVLKERYKDFLNILLLKLLEKTDLNNTSTTDNYLGQPTNENANLFFEFLCEHYRPEDKTQVKYVNILYYLKNDAEKKHFIYKVKQKDYKKLIESKGIKISKFDKSANYEEVEKPIFYTLENTFLKNKTV